MFSTTNCFFVVPLLWTCCVFYFIDIHNSKYDNTTLQQNLVNIAPQNFKIASFSFHRDNFLRLALRARVNNTSDWSFFGFV
jgi:hypothetical protein